MYERNERNQFDDSGSPSEGRSGLSPALIGLIVVAIATLVFVLRNGDRTSIDFLVADVQSRLWLVIAISLAVGVLLDRLVIAWWRRRRR